MQGSDGECGSGATRRETLLINRRSYLKLAGIAAGSVPLLTGTASAAFERRGIEFERSVNMVTEAGCDPTGQVPCDEQITEAADDHTLLKFPAGEYKLTEKNVILNKTNLGFLGIGDVRFSVPERFNEKVLVVDDGTGLLFENIDIDLTAYGATPGLHLGVADDLQVHDVEFIGQGIHPDSIPRGEPGWEPGLGPENGNPNVTNALYPIVRSPDGTGEVTNLVAKNRGLMGTYNAGKGRIGLWVGVATEGTITFRDCVIEEFGNNGCYTSRTYGVVNYEGGLYRNNDNNQVRIGSPGSSADGATFIVDAERSDSPNPYDALNQRGARVEMGHNYVPTDVTISNCDIAIRSTSHSGGGVVAERTASEFRIENTRIGVDIDTVRGVLAKEPNGGVYEPPAKPHDGVLRNVSITGSASGTAAVELIGRPNSVVEGCCIHQEGGGRDGVILDNSGGSVVRNSTIDVTGERVITPGCQATASNISPNGSCPMPAYGGSYDLTHTLSIESNGGRYSYEFTVSGGLEKRDTADPNDIISGNTASGQGGGGGIDAYEFSGEILAFDLDGDVTVYLDGERINPGRYLDHVLTIEGSGSRAEYTVAAAETLEKSTANGASVNPKDDQWRTTASGFVIAGRDSYALSGGIAALQVDDSAVVYLNGERIDPDRYPDHVLTVTGNGSRTTYTFTTTSDIEPSTANGGTFNSNSTDTIKRTTASGEVWSGADSYAFSGEIAAFRAAGNGTFYLDGRKVDPANYLNKVLTIVGTGSRAEYDVTATKALEKTTVPASSINPDDDISGRSAHGYVVGGADSYALSWTIERLSIDGDARVYLDGEHIVSDRFRDGVLTIEGPGSHTDYTLSVSGDLEKSTANGASINPKDELSGSTASGFVVAGRDSYAFTENITQLVIDGRARVELDRSNHTITFRGKRQGATYTFSVSGGVEGVTHEPNTRRSDTVHAHGAEGFVYWGSDTYRYTGDLESLEVGGTTVSVER